MSTVVTTESRICENWNSIISWRIKSRVVLIQCRKEGGEKRLLTKSSLLSLLLFCQPQLYFGGKSKQSLFKTLRGKVTSGPYWKSFLSTPGKTLFSFVLSSLVICRRIFPNKTAERAKIHCIEVHFILWLQNSFS